MTTASEFEAQAAAWLVRRDGSALSEQEQAAFDAWLASDPRAHAAFLRLEMAWKRADNLRRLRPLDGAVDEDLLAHSPFAPVPIDEYSAREVTGRSLVATEASSAEAHENASAPLAVDGEYEGSAELEEFPPRRRWLLPFAAAATLMVAAVGAAIWIAYERTGWHEYSTDFGGFERIVLDDGSVIHLNTHSAMHVQLTNELRQIILDRGEALFKVAHDPTRPFDVQAGGTTVRAVGTEFSVRLREPSETSDDGRDVEVLVKEGRVAIDPPKKQLERAEILPASVSTLSAGEAVVISAKRMDAPQMSVQKVADAEVSRKLSWTEGRLWFERQKLKDVVAEFNRYNRRQMVIADPAIADLRIGGGFSATDPESFIAALERTLGVRAFPSPSSGGDEAETIRLVGTRENEN